MDEMDVDAREAEWTKRMDPEGNPSAKPLRLLMINERVIEPKPQPVMIQEVIARLHDGELQGGDLYRQMVDNDPAWSDENLLGALQSLGALIAYGLELVDMIKEVCARRELFVDRLLPGDNRPLNRFEVTWNAFNDILDRETVSRFIDTIKGMPEGM